MASEIVSPEPQIIAVKLTPVGERSVRSKHPWIFSDSIRKMNKEGSAGDVTVIFDHKSNKIMGIGLYDPQSPIRIKMLHFESGATLNEDYFRAKIEKAYAVRVPLLAEATNSYRLLFGENDGFPGLIADVYAHVLVIKLYSSIWWRYLDIILNLLVAVSGVTTVVLRLSRNVQKEKRNNNLKDGTVLLGELENENITFTEHGVKFSANVLQGHKTGYFLDHRFNRKRVGALSQGKTVLDVFAYAGGFSVHALVGGAVEVTSVDISEQALTLAKENGMLNTYAGKHHILVGDAFALLQNLITSGKRFDIVVIDPPSFAKSAKEVVGAEKKYAELATLGIQLIAPKGLLVLASCSSRVSAESFLSINEKALEASRRHYELETVTYHDIDHPIGFPEGAYLKCGYYRFSR
jgi:23S rRNA (cytosine1962-C5)-methyltransferase